VAGTVVKVVVAVPRKSVTLHPENISFLTRMVENKKSIIVSAFP
jgi:hypothetical protein